VRQNEQGKPGKTDYLLIYSIGSPFLFFVPRLSGLADEQAWTASPPGSFYLKWLEYFWDF
jgi:hypothetical protein